MKIVAVFAVLLAFFTAGCGHSAYMLREPRVFGACSSLGKNNRQESYNAIIYAVSNRRGWLIDETDQSKFIIRAQVRRGLEMSIPILFKVDQSGKVKIIRDPERPKDLSYRWTDNLLRWMNMLEGIYNGRRCNVR